MQTSWRPHVRDTVGAAYMIVARAPAKMLGLAAIPPLGLALLFWALYEAFERIDVLIIYARWVLAGYYVLQYALFVLIFGALVGGAIRVDRDESFDFVSAVATSLLRLPQLIGASWYVFAMETSVVILSLAAESTAAYALLVAVMLGLTIATSLGLSIPVCLIERRGPLASTVRAFRLTRGSRWRLFSAVFVALIPIFGLAILSFVVGKHLDWILASLAIVLLNAVLAALCATAYNRLEQPEAAAGAVFD